MSATCVGQKQKHLFHETLFPKTNMFALLNNVSRNNCFCFCPTHKDILFHVRISLFVSCFMFSDVRAHWALSTRQLLQYTHSHTKLYCSKPIVSYNRPTPKRREVGKWMSHSRHQTGRKFCGTNNKSNTFEFVFTPSTIVFFPAEKKKAPFLRQRQFKQEFRNI